MTLGLTNGTTNVGLTSSGFSASYSSEGFGKQVGTATPNGTTMSGSVGVIADLAKSGLKASLSDTNIGEVNVLKLGKYILKY